MHVLVRQRVGVVVVECFVAAGGGDAVGAGVAGCVGAVAVELVLSEQCFEHARQHTDETPKEVAEGAP